MTVEEARTLKSGQEIYYKGLEILPEKVIVDKIIYNNQGKIEIHLVDNCYIPERDLQDYVFLTFDECAKSCEKCFKDRLAKLKEMLKSER